jgi:hypothetical protein
MVSVVLLMGTEGVGKSTVANHLVTEHGFVELSFASALRESAIAMWNGIAAMSPELPVLTIDDTQDRVKKEAPIGDLVLAGRPFSPRVLLQWFGTDIMRNMVADDIWAHATISRLRKEIASGNTRFVFSDYRFPNEYESVKAFLEQHGFSVPLTVRLVPGNITAEELSRVKEAAIQGHPSARGWVTLPADIEIANPLAQETMNIWLTDVCQRIINRV